RPSALNRIREPSGRTKRKGSQRQDRPGQLPFPGGAIPIELNSSPRMECPANTDRVSLNASITVSTSSPEPIGRISSGGSTGSAESAPCDAVNMARSSEFGREPTMGRTRIHGLRRKEKKWLVGNFSRIEKF